MDRGAVRVKWGKCSPVHLWMMLLLIPAALCLTAAVYADTPPPPLERTTRADSLTSLPLPQALWLGTKAEVSGIAHDAVSIHLSPVHWDRGDWMVTGGILLAAGGLHMADQQVYDAIRRNRRIAPLEPVLSVGYDIEKSALKAVNTKYYVGGAVLGALLRHETLYEVSMGTLEGYLIGGLTLRATWLLAGRSRPITGRSPYHFALNDGASFISGHASNAFLMATVASMNIKNLPLQILAYSYASAIALQRIADRRHWPSDVLLGAVHGVVIGRAVVRHRQVRGTGLRPVLIGENATPGLEWVVYLR